MARLSARCVALRWRIASGLAAGKGVIIAENEDQAERALAAMLLEQVFGEAGHAIVIEEYLEGVEASILAFTDGKTILPLLSAKDHKKIEDGEKGLNTGGMGVVVPNPHMTAAMDIEFINDILTPTLRGIQLEDMEFTGVIFFGLMLTKSGIYLLEYNMRLGDPETQAILPLLNNDLVEVIEMTVAGNLSAVKLAWESAATCCVVLASGGYPESFHGGYKISGLTSFNATDCILFTASVTRHGSEFHTAPGRVLNVVAKGATPEQARAKAYSAINEIQFKNMYCRTDIGESI